ASPTGTPAVMTTRSPCVIKFDFIAVAIVRSSISSVDVAASPNNGYTPHTKFNFLTVCSSLVTAIIGDFGRYFDTTLDVYPLSVAVNIAAADSFEAVWTTD